MRECDALPTTLASVSSAYKGCASLPLATHLLPLLNRTSVSPGHGEPPKSPPPRSTGSSLSTPSLPALPPLQSFHALPALPAVTSLPTAPGPGPLTSHISRYPDVSREPLLSLSNHTPSTHASPPHLPCQSGHIGLTEWTHPKVRSLPPPARSRRDPGVPRRLLSGPRLRPAPCGLSSPCRGAPCGCPFPPRPPRLRTHPERTRPSSPTPPSSPLTPSSLDTSPAKVDTSGRKLDTFGRKGDTSGRKLDTLARQRGHIPRCAHSRPRPLPP